MSVYFFTIRIFGDTVPWRHAIYFSFISEYFLPPKYAICLRFSYFKAHDMIRIIVSLIRWHPNYRCPHKMLMLLSKKYYFFFFPISCLLSTVAFAFLLINPVCWGKFLNDCIAFGLKWSVDLENYLLNYLRFLVPAHIFIIGSNCWQKKMCRNP